MRMVNFHTPTGQRIWRQYRERRTGDSDSTRLRHDPLTLKLFRRPVTARQAVAEIIKRVRRQGDTALLKYARVLDGWNPGSAGLRIPEMQRQASARRVAPQLQRALRTAAKHIRDFHRAQRIIKSCSQRRKGVRLWERRRSLDRIGIYVPGGRAPLISTVLMNALPAQVAGVREIIMATPPGKNGEIHPAILYAAQLAGVQEIFRVGGAAAIAAMAFGTTSIKKVHKIVGPGSIFVVEAKRQVVGEVGIDSLAGPSEILIIADKSADPQNLAWDLLAQGEHGSGAVGILLTPDEKLIAAVIRETKAIARQNPELKPAGQENVIFKVRHMEEALALGNAYAPEHLSLQVRNAGAWLNRIKYAGAVFLGSITAQAMGDYIAGSNHVLPTGRTACWASPLAVADFEHCTSVVQYTHEGMRREGQVAIAIAAAEGLTAHVGSIRQRIKGEKNGKPAVRI
ncbi:histidinol dehydrogenase [bacterium]|nr:histidinol dehydrogenase [bacterium]